jgi:3-deoxy-manno-octulosonate cytidylyltransferase (CMP-KDO synthetase)
MRILAVIPARWASSRFPGKPLAIISGKPMVQWVWERARRARRVDDVIIATDDERIRDAAEHFGARVELTSEHLASGTDRVAEVAARHGEYQILLNVQGDEPLIASEVLDAVAEPLIENSSLPVATAMTRVADSGGELQNPDVVKIVVDHKRNALYFSRAPIPFNRRDASPETRSLPITGYRHLGIYGYQRDALIKLASLAPSPLEQVEELEQLRFLEAGFVIRCVEVAPSGPSVDRPEDIPKVEALLKQEGR